MERLNDFMNRSATRRPANPEREQTQPYSEQFSSQPQAPGRRPLPEQRPPVQRTTHRRFANTGRPEQTMPMPPTPPAPQNYGAGPTHYSPLSRQRLADYGASTYSQYREDEQPKIPYAPEYSTPPQTHYYRTDDTLHTIEADVQEEKLLEAEEDEVDNVQGSYRSWQTGDYESQDGYPYTTIEPAADTLTGRKAYYDISTTTGPGIRKGSPDRLRNNRTNNQDSRLPATTTPSTIQNRGAGQARTTRQLSQPPMQNQLSVPSRTAVPASPPQQRIPQPAVQHPLTRIQPRLPDVGTFISPVAKPICSKCRGAGYLRADVPFGHPNFGKPIACECKEAERKTKRRMQLREMSNMDAFQDSSFDTFHRGLSSGVREAYEAAISYASEPRGWLVMLGPNGCGKTHLAAAIANKCLEDGAVVLFAVVPDLLDHLRAAFAPTATEMYDQLFSKMREAEILILDDLGAQQSSPWANEKLFQLLNYRYNLEMPTVVTANPKGFQGMDERIRSRLGDVGLTETINFNNARDYRPNHARLGRA